MATPDNGDGNGGARALSGWEKRLLALLGMPTFAFALSITLVTTYLPVIAERFTGSTAIIGLIIGAEGLVAIVLPLIVGPWSDQLRSPIGGRLPFLLIGGPVMAGTLAILGLVGSLWLLALLVFVFFSAYYVAYEPYRALYPDALEGAVAGRGQSSQAVFRGVGTGTALIGGGLLFSVDPLLPFLAFGVLALGVVAEFLWGMITSELYSEESREERTARETLREIRDMLARRPELRAYLVANALWEMALAALKTFIILFLTVGVGLSMTASVGVIGFTAMFILAAAATAGKLGDRFGQARVVTAALWVFGLGAFLPFVTQNPWIVIPTLPFLGYAGGVVLALPYAVLIPLMPKEEHGLLTGFYSATRGIGIMLGPIVAGLAIMGLRGALSETAGYAAMWLVISAALLTSIPYMRWLRAGEARRAEREEAGAGASSGQPATA